MYVQSYREIDGEADCHFLTITFLPLPTCHVGRGRNAMIKKKFLLLDAEDRSQLRLYYYSVQCIYPFSFSTLAVDAVVLERVTS